MSIRVHHAPNEKGRVVDTLIRAVPAEEETTFHLPSSTHEGNIRRP
jgi:hypothetical protein